ncbi:MAG: hypothetical protein JXR58_00870 [Bacteroidales bacterium]|nr:hypothetical protein [Bacteroidales bacterium]
MKKAFAILIVFILVVPFAGTYYWLQLRKYQLKKEVRKKIIAGIPKEELVVLRFSVSETKTVLKWKHSKEFEYKGEMYDIVDTEFLNDSVVYYVWWDNEETQLEKQLKNLANEALGKDPIAKNRLERFNSFVNTLYFCNHESMVFYTSDYVQKFQFVIIHYRGIVISPPSPPPLFVV